MTRSAHYVVTQPCRAEGRLALAINNKGRHCTCRSHTILPGPVCLCFGSSVLSSPAPSPPPAGWHGLGVIQSQGPAPVGEAAGHRAQAGYGRRCELTHSGEPGAGAFVSRLVVPKGDHNSG